MGRGFTQMNTDQNEIVRIVDLLKLIQICFYLCESAARSSSQTSQSGDLKDPPTRSSLVYRGQAHAGPSRGRNRIACTHQTGKPH